MAGHLVWMVETEPDNPLGTVLEQVMPESTVLAPASLTAPWRGPSGHRPLAVVVGIPIGGTERAVAMVQQIGNRTHLPVVALFERPSADLRHAILRAGAVATLTMADTELGRKRLRRQLASALHLAQDGSEDVDRPSRERIRIIAIGSSTGGPETLAQVLPGYGPFDPPVVIAQHVHPGYDAPLASFLSDRGLPCKVAEDGDAVRGGRVLLAPAGTDMVLHNGKVALKPACSQYVPGVDALFESVALEYGNAGVGVLLTGMGNDGAKGLLAMNQAGAFTVTQRGDTCVVDGMPSSARALHAQTVDWTPQELRDWLASLRDAALTG